MNGYRLMRHGSVDTTMGHYVALDSADVADELWAKFGAPYNISYNSGPEHAPETEMGPADESTEPVINPSLTPAEGTGIEPATPCGAPHFQCGR